MKITQESTLFDVWCDYWALQTKGESPPEREFAGILVRAITSVFLEGGNGGHDIELTAQAKVEGLGYRLDFLLVVSGLDGKPVASLAFEVDGLAYHGDQQAFARDRKRDRDLAEAGIETYRYTAKEVTDQPGNLLTEVTRIVGALASRAFKKELGGA